MTQRNLQSDVDGASWGSHCCQNPCCGRSNIRAKGERVHAAQFETSHSDERGEGGGEHGAALDEHRQPCPHQDDQIAGQAGEGAGQLGVDRCPEGVRDPAAKQGVEDLHKDHQAAREERDGEEEEQEACHSVAHVNVAEQGVTCNTNNQLQMIIYIYIYIYIYTYTCFIAQGMLRYIHTYKHTLHTHTYITYLQTLHTYKHTLHTHFTKTLDIFLVQQH